MSNFMRAKLVVLIFVFATLLSAPALAGNSNTGTTAYSFLKLGTSARALSMGGAFSGLADDESAIYYNPAGITGMTQKAISASYMNYIADIQSGNFIFVLPRGIVEADQDDFLYYEDDEALPPTSESGLAISLVYLNYGTIDETNSEGSIIGDFGGSDMALAVSYARQVSSQLSMGASGKVVYEKIDEYSSTGVAADLGLLYRFKDGRTRAGVSASNLGAQLSGLTEEHKDPLPILLRAGLSHTLRGTPLTVAGEGVFPSDNDLYGSIGLEFNPDIPIALRAGYTTFGSNYKTEGDSDGAAGFSFGAGFTLPQVAVDYAFLPYADLGSLHRINFAYRWQ
jgi:hypothetical protein